MLDVLGRMDASSGNSASLSFAVSGWRERWERISGAVGTDGDLSLDGAGTEVADFAWALLHGRLPHARYRTLNTAMELAGQLQDPERSLDAGEASMTDVLNAGMVRAAPGRSGAGAGSDHGERSEASRGGGCSWLISSSGLASVCSAATSSWCKRCSRSSMNAFARLQPSPSKLKARFNDVRKRLMNVESEIESVAGEDTLAALQEARKLVRQVEKEVFPDIPLGSEQDAVLPKENDLEADLVRKAETNVTKLDGLVASIGSKPVAELWETYHEIELSSRRLFYEYVDLVRGVALRSSGFDRDLCRIADELVRTVSRKWRSITIPSRLEEHGIDFWTDHPHRLPGVDRLERPARQCTNTATSSPRWFPSSTRCWRSTRPTRRRRSSSR